MNGFIQEKRNYQGLPYWEPGINSLNNLDVQAYAALGMPVNGSSDEPQNDWDSYRLAAAYSANFHGGPQARLFYHRQADNGSTFVQEMIWTQNNDSWAYGQVVGGSVPYSHLAVTIDEVTKTLRLFYSAGNLTLQESWLNLTDPNPTYQRGTSSHCTLYRLTDLKWQVLASLTSLRMTMAISPWLLLMVQLWYIITLNRISLFTRSILPVSQALLIINKSTVFLTQAPLQWWRSRRSSRTRLNRRFTSRLGHLSRPSVARSHRFMSSGQSRRPTQEVVMPHLRLCQDSLVRPGVRVVMGLE